MRVLQIHCRYRFEGGEEAVVASEAELLAAHGVEVVQYQVENPESGGQAALTLAQSLWNRSARRAVDAEIERVRPDVVHIHNTWFTLSHSVFGAGHAAGLPTVATFHNYRQSCINSLFLRNGVACDDCRGHGPWRGAIRKCYRDSYVMSGIAAGTLAFHQQRKTLANELDVATVMTEFGADILVDAGLRREQVVVMPHGVHDPGPRTVHPSASDTVLFVGRLSEEKGPQFLVDAWMAAPPEGLVLELVGDGPLDAELRAAAAGCPSIRFAGRIPRSEVERLVLGARAVAVPSLCYEGQPLSLLESLGAGLPVIVADHPPLRGTLAGTEAGILVEPGNTAAWTRELARLNDLDWIGRASTAGRRLFETEYDRELGGARLLEVYERIVNAAGARRTPR
ncbi:MAG: glycosyltransferase family 4 protein [Acidimicrobiales bacterium]